MTNVYKILKLGDVVTVAQIWAVIKSSKRSGTTVIKRWFYEGSNKVQMLKYRIK